MLQDAAGFFYFTKIRPLSPNASILTSWKKNR